MGWQAEEIADVDTVVANHERRNSYTLLTTDLTDYVAWRRLMAKKVEIRGGEYLTFNAKVAANDTAQLTALFDEIDVDQADLMKTGKVPWRHATNHYMFDEREPRLNCSKEDLVKIIKVRRADCREGFAVKGEGWFWAEPTGDEASEDAPPYGVKYWIQQDNTDTDGAIQGGNPTGFASGCAGLSSTTYPNWQNYSVGYDAISDDDFLELLIKAAAFTNFKNPVAVPGDKPSRYGYYTNWTVFNALRKLAKANNDNLGYDLLTKAAMFNGSAVEYVPHLNADTTTNPFYGIDWNVFQPVFLTDEWMHETVQIRQGKQHRVVVKHMDCSFNFECTNRRKLFVLYKV